MKISKNADGSKAVEIAPTDSGDTVLHLQGDTAMTADNRETGYRSPVADIRQTGEVDFYSRPSVGGVDVALSTDSDESLETVSRTIMDNSTTVIPICPVQRVVNVLYFARNSGTSEAGNIRITQGATGFTVTVQQDAEPGYFSDLEFSASENNGSLLLSVIGSGAGLVTDFEYRVNATNTLYL